jgi:hypothetical protein
VFVLKFDKDHKPTYATYYGGRGHDVGTAVTANASGEVYFTGYTDSPSFPELLGQPSTVFNRSWFAFEFCGFIVSLSSDGRFQRWTTFVPNNGSSVMNAIAIDKSGNVYVGGVAELTGSAPLFNPGGGAYYQNFSAGSPSSNPVGDIYLLRVNAAHQLTWATFLGAPGSEELKGLAIDANNNVFITGYTTSTASATFTPGSAFPLVQPGGAYVSGNSGQQDVFVVKFNPSAQITWSTLFGGSGNDLSISGFSSFWNPGLAGLAYSQRIIGVNSTGNVYITGSTVSSNFPRQAPPSATGFNQGKSTGNDAFLTQFSNNGSLIWSTLIGGTGYDQANALTFDNNDNVYLGGYTTSESLLNNNFYKPNNFDYTQPVNKGGADAFIVKFDSQGNHLWGSFFGGSGNDEISSLHFSKSDNTLYLGGYTQSPSTPVIGFPVKASPNPGAYNQLTKSAASTPANTDFDGFIGSMTPQGLCRICDVVRLSKPKTSGALNEELKISLYPNPVKGTLNIAPEGTDEVNLSVTIFNTLGQKVFTTEFTAASQEISQINLAEYPKGLYLVKIQSGNKILNKQIMVE